MFDFALKMINSYFGPSKHIWLLAISFIVLLLYQKKMKYSRVIVCFTSVFFMIYLMPICVKIIITYCIPDNTYWRMIWIVPIPIIISYVFTYFFCRSKRKYIRFFGIIIAVLIIILTGYNMYGYSLYKKPENIYKLPQDTLDIADIVHSDGKERGLECLCLMVPNELVSSIRQYDATIKMPYGRDMVKTQCGLTPYWENPDENVGVILRSFSETACNYIAWPKSTKVYMQLIDFGLIYIGESNNFYVFYYQIE